MPLTLNIIERLAFLTLNQAPAASLDMWAGPAFWSVQAAMKLDLFETLAHDRMTAAQIAARLDADENGITILLGVLRQMGYVQQSGDSYRNSAMTRKWLLDSGELNFTPFFLFWAALMDEFMPNLAESIRSGSPPVHLYEWIENQPEVSRYFQEGQIQIARYVSGDIVRAVSIPSTVQRLLDVGGGHGEYSIALCRQHAQLSAVVFDGAQALVTGEKAIAAAGMNERMAVQAGNFMVDALPQGFDVALVFNIVHGLKPAENIDLFRKIKSALNPDGQIVVLEQVHGIAPLPIINALSHILSIAYYHNIGGQVYRYEDIRDWLAAAGFGDIKRKNILKASSVLVSAVR